MKIEILKGVSGYAIYLNDYRLCGPKPWHGGTTVASWDVTKKTIRKALSNDLVKRHNNGE